MAAIQLAPQNMNTITINNRELLRKYKLYREQLLNGDIDRIIIPVNGKKIYMAVLKDKKHRQGDIRPLLEKLKKLKPRKWIRPARLEWSMKSIQLMEKLWRKK